MHLTSNPIDWYAARAGGIAAYLLLSINVSIGLLMSGKKSIKRWPKFALEDVHRFTGILTGTFIVIHVVTVAIDSFIPFSLVSLVVPFIATYRPIWTGLGIVAAELLLALAFTNHYRSTKIDYAFWRKAHYANFAVWGAATFHGIGSGTDRSTVWMVAIYAVAVGTVTGLTVWRVLRSTRARSPVIRTTPVAAGVLGVALIAVLSQGPLRFQPKEWNAATFQDTLTGQILQDLGATEGIVSFAGSGDGSQKVLVRADLLVTTTKLANTSFQMEYLPSGTLCSGEVTTVHSTSFDATCTMPSGSKRSISANWDIGTSSDIQNGTITSHP